MDKMSFQFPFFTAIVDNIDFGLPNGKWFRTLLLCCLFVIGFIAGKFSIATMFAWISDFIGK